MQSFLSSLDKFDKFFAGCCWSGCSVFGLYPWAFYRRTFCNFNSVDVC